MRIGKAYKTVIFYIAVFFAAMAAYQIFPSITIHDKNSSSFSSERVAADINIISKRPHSIEHPKERKVVANYLFHRLEQMGGDVQSFEYDSIKCKFGGYFNVENILATFEPPQGGDSSKYLLLVAHYDSRYHQKVLEDTVYSYGAADDGYGVGVILESVSQALKYQKEWSQGIKVLFTDAEEHALDGMRNMARYDNHILENVNLVMNVEARGVKGPVLLFETSNGNSKVMKLYKHARGKYAYSLTTLVYRVLPNDTDFTVVKDSIPGFNFAVIDNLKYYHTNRDNFSNISLKSLQHYGLQMEPMVEEYLKNPQYSSKEAFVSEKDLVFFTIPVLGFFYFAKMEYIIINVVVFLLLAFVFLIYSKWKNVRIVNVFRCMKWPLLFSVGSFSVGELIGWLSAHFNGEEFDFVSVKYVEYDYIITIVSILVLLLWTLIFYRLKGRRSVHFSYEFIFAVLFFVAILSFVLLVAFVENFFILVPLAVTVIALLFGVVKLGRIMFLLSGIVIMLLGFSFCYILATALTIGSLGVVMMLCWIYLSLLIGHYYLFKRNL